MTLGPRIKELRVKSGLTQEKLGKQLGISNVVLSSYETEERNPPLSCLIKIAKRFNVTTDYLLGIEENTPLYTGNLTTKQIATLQYLIRCWEKGNKKAGADQ